METAKIVKFANDTINSDENIKMYYPYVKEVYIEPLGTIDESFRLLLTPLENVSKPRYDFNKCKFHVHLTVPFSEFYESFLKLYKSNHFKNRIMSPVYEYLFEKYQIDIAFMIDYYVWKALKRENILFDSNYKIDIYSSDGKEINPIDKVFPK